MAEGRDRAKSGSSLLNFVCGVTFGAKAVHVVGYNSDLYDNMTEAVQSTNGLVTIALLGQITRPDNPDSGRPNPAFDLIAQNFKYVKYKACFLRSFFNPSILPPSSSPSFLFTPFHPPLPHGHFQSNPHDDKNKGDTAAVAVASCEEYPVSTATSGLQEPTHLRRSPHRSISLISIPHDLPIQSPPSSGLSSYSPSVATGAVYFASASAVTIAQMLDTEKLFRYSRFR
ncbi:hypothetical protein NP493_433g02030 [Ridgeia piscesae]|uniref:Uncharacterized protein n=1 Tax=Ridgeia piscesae TaxID=27915 RepID=A0AAD9NS09_RIDPI|nr:hypothetical protein NP493_433g02030 [Ridgeia piscesae]